MSKHTDLTQKYSTFGDKLLAHTDVLNSIQNEKKYKPITVQLAPNEGCTSGCPFCSVSERPLKSVMPFDAICRMLAQFKSLGAKSVEITGGGEPLLYYDKQFKANINDIIDVANDLGFDIGIITNTVKLRKLKPEVFDKIKWIRISLIGLDEGNDPESYDFNGFPITKMGFSYIIYSDTEATGSRKGRFTYKPTSKETIEKIYRLVELHPEIKFVRIAGNCLIKGNNQKIKEEYTEIIDTIDKYGKMFIKDIGFDDSPFRHGCYVGAIRPYIAPHPEGGNYQVYICTSHVLHKRTYDLDYSLGSVEDVCEIWDKMNKSYKENGYPYEIKGNKGTKWDESCKFCYYFNNNKLLHTVSQEMPDANFP